MERVRTRTTVNFTAIDRPPGIGSPKSSPFGLISWTCSPGRSLDRVLGNVFVNHGVSGGDQRDAGGVRLQFS